MISIIVNAIRHDLDVPAEMPLLWVLRDVVGLTGTKFGCGSALCGCCTVHVDGRPMRSCVLPIASVAERSIVTIEGLSANGLHAVQLAWIQEQVPQCGYCQSGQIMAAVALLAETPNPTDQQIDSAMSNICRCGTYDRIRKAIHRAAASLRGADK
jgi:isoquinoline 1-oxidoreductase alpha subunit